MENNNQPRGSPILEHILVKTHDNGKNHEMLKEAEIMQRHQHHENSQAVREAILMEQVKTNKLLEEILKELKNNK